MLTLSLLIGCFKVGDPQNIQNITPLKAEKYINKLRKACSKDKEQACFDLGKVYETGIVNRDISNSYVVDPNREWAVALYQQACNLNYTEACFSLAELFVRSPIVNDTQNTIAQAYNLYTMLCDQENYQGCRQQAMMLRDGFDDKIFGEFFYYLNRLFSL